MSEKFEKIVAITNVLHPMHSEAQILLSQTPEHSEKVYVWMITCIWKPVYKVQVLTPAPRPTNMSTNKTKYDT